MRNYPIIFLNAEDNSIDETSNAFFMGQNVAGCFTVINSETSVGGTVQIQGSNDIPIGDPKSYVPAASSWVNITDATSTITAGVADAIILPTISFQYLRCTFTNSSGGAGTITVAGSFTSV